MAFGAPAVAKGEGSRPEQGLAKASGPAAAGLTTCESGAAVLGRGNLLQSPFAGRWKGSGGMRRATLGRSGRKAWTLNS